MVKTVKMYELSKKLDITSKELIETLHDKFNINVKNGTIELKDEDYLKLISFYIKDDFINSPSYKQLLNDYNNKKFNKALNYAVITSDVIKSKKIDKLNNIMVNKLYKINKLYINELLTPFTTSRGDEIQAVCKDVSYLPKIIRNLRYLCLPIKLRIGIGIGTIEYNPNTINSWDMNGSAFFNARIAIDNLKNEISPCTYMDASYGKSRLEKIDINQISINTIFSLMDSIANRWTLRQWEAIYYYDKFKTYEKVAKELNVSWQSIQKRLKSADWITVEDAEANLCGILCKVYSKS